MSRGRGDVRPWSVRPRTADLRITFQDRSVAKSGCGLTQIGDEWPAAEFIWMAAKATRLRRRADILRKELKCRKKRSLSRPCSECLSAQARPMRQAIPRRARKGSRNAPPAPRPNLQKHNLPLPPPGQSVPHPPPPLPSTPPPPLNTLN